MSFNYHYIRTDDFSADTGGGAGAIITRENYELFFVMYVDNELDADERNAVERFVQQNPDLEEELVMLQQSVLHADEHIVFEQKELLFKDAAAAINEQNCEAFFVLYGDDELTNEEKDRVEQFVYKHPQYQAEFELIQQVKLVPDNTLIFPDKTYLYRTEENDSRIVVFPWWRLSAAAIALLVVGSLAWYISIQNNGVEVAKNDGETKPKVIKPLPADPDKNVYADSMPLAYDKGPVFPNTQVDSLSAMVINEDHSTIISSKKKKNLLKDSNIQQPLFVQHKSDQRPDNPAGVEKSFSAKPVKVAVDNSYEQPVVKSGIIKLTINEPLAVNTLAEKPEDDNDLSQTAILTASVNKTPLRGFFRKVTRVVDKVTNSADDGNGGIRIANLEIALK